LTLHLTGDVNLNLNLSLRLRRSPGSAARPAKGKFSEDQGSGEGKMKSGARREDEQVLTAFVHKFEVCYQPWEGCIG
jgi:hypothetical protein